jgi:hypothetical protein
MVFLLAFCHIWGWLFRGNRGENEGKMVLFGKQTAFFENKGNNMA